MTKLDEIRKRLDASAPEDCWVGFLDRKLFAPGDIALLRNAPSDLALLLRIVERQREALEKLREHHKAWINGARADVIYERMDKEFECIAEVDKMVGGDA